LQTGIEANDFPSCVYLIAEKGEIIYRDALGFAVVEPEKIEAKIETIYDLASLTKPLVTGLLCAKLIESYEINLSDKVAKFFPKFNAETTIQNLLTHSSGMIAWKPFYLICDLRFAICDLIAEESHGAKPNQSIIYSDLNFLTLTFLLEKLYGKRLDKIAHDEIFTPLKLKDTFYNPPNKLQKRIAASETGNKFELQMCREKGYDLNNQAIENRKSKIENRTCWGEVHDGNCYFMNGVSGHAGLFSTAAETFKIAQQFLADQTQLLKPETCNLFRTNFTPNLNEARSIAFQLAATEKSTASEALAKDSFGHLGFAGTSLWIEPETERIFILFTNRTHARELPFVNINSVRRTFHEIAAEQLNGK
jgi:serine-type D-Ala-D-Ala carboxypeptidase